ncbi:MAG: hypothetical protein AAGA08_17685 [Pseudomonadota bacterium]
MRQPFATSCALITILVLAACTALESNRAGSPFLAPNGAERRTQIAASYSLPRRYLSFEVYGNADSMRRSSRFRIDRKPDQEVLGPDPNPLFRYLVNYVPSRFSRDEVDFEIEKQILKSVTVATDDQTGQTLINLARSLGNISRLAADLDPTPGAGLRDSTAETLVAKLKFDPTDPVSVARTRNILSHNATHGVDLQITPPPRAITAVPGCDYAICYRPLITVTLSFIDKRSGNVTEHVVSVPDPHQVTGIDIERSPFVRRDTILTFADGTLTNVDITKPSELAAAALLPLEIVTAVFEGTNTAISSLLGLKQNELNSSAELLNAQASFLNALKAYREVELNVFGPPPTAELSGEDSLPGARAEEEARPKDKDAETRAENTDQDTI